MSLNEAAQAPPYPPMSPPRTCRQSRMISDRVTEEEHNAGKVRCVECWDLIPDPHL